MGVYYSQQRLNLETPRGAFHSSSAYTPAFENKLISYSKEAEDGNNQTENVSLLLHERTERGGKGGYKQITIAQLITLLIKNACFGIVFFFHI